MQGRPVVRAAGCVIARQRPVTAKEFIFISMEDETGIANIIVTPDLYEEQMLIVTRSKFLLAEGTLQKVDGVPYYNKGWPQGDVFLKLGCGIR